MFTLVFAQPSRALNANNLIDRHVNFSIQSIISHCNSGTNFPRIGMQRIRRAADAAAKLSPRQLTPLLDLHTGEDPSPPAVSYASHYPMIDYVRNFI